MAGGCREAVRPAHAPRSLTAVVWGWAGRGEGASDCVCQSSPGRRRGSKLRTYPLGYSPSSLEVVMFESRSSRFKPVTLLIAAWKRTYLSGLSGGRGIFQHFEIAPGPSLPFCPATSMFPGYQFCGFCGKRAQDGHALLACARCQLVSYCNKSCQRQAWEGGHQASCVPVLQREEIMLQELLRSKKEVPACNWACGRLSPSSAPLLFFLQGQLPR